MAMQCGDILKLPSLREVKVAAGAAGLNRPLRWIYVAECLESTIQITDWIYGEELVFVSGVNVKDNPALLLDVVRKLNDKKAAGMIIYIGPYIKEIPRQVLEEAERLSFPIFQLPWETKLVTVSHDICHAITLKEVEEKTLDDLLMNILFSGPEMDPQLLMRAEYYGYIPDKPARICIADIDDFAEYIKTNDLSEESSIVEIKLSIKRIIQHAIADRGKTPILMMRSDSIICLLQTRNETAEDFLTSLFEYVQGEIRRIYPTLTLTIGIGNGYMSLDKMRNSLDEAEMALKAGKCRPNKKRFNYYKDIGIFSILFNVGNRQVLENYYSNTLGAVIEYDRLNNTTLFRTLEIFFQSDGNLAEASGKLFIHKNTLKYRMMKIEEITGLSIKNISGCTRLELALLIGHMLKQERK